VGWGWVEEEDGEDCAGTVELRGGENEGLGTEGLRGYGLRD